MLAKAKGAQALVQASIALATAFGLNWNGVQIGATMAFSAAVLAFLTQKAVTPSRTPSFARARPSP